MRVPPTLEPLVEMGIIQAVVRPLMSGKEAQLYIVEAGGLQRVAKVYKDATQRSFRQRVEYTEGRRIRSSRDRRAINSRTRHGREQDEAAWRSAEVDVIYRLQSAGVRVPEPYNFAEGVLVMELVTGADGEPAPRLGDVQFSAQGTQEVYDRVLQQVVQMLCAGVVHGDLSEFNVLMAADGPVVIDFPQAVDAARNSSARGLLLRDVDNLHRFLERGTGQRPRPFAQEMWALLERNELTPESRMRGTFRDKRGKANTKAVLDLIGDAERDEQRRRQAQGQDQGGGRGRRGRSGARQRGAAQGPQVEVLVRSKNGRVRAAQPDATGTPAKGIDPPRHAAAKTGANGPDAARHAAAKTADGAAEAEPSADHPRRKRRRRRRSASAQGQPTNTEPGRRRP